MFSAYQEKGRGWTHYSARERFWAIQNLTANSHLQFITSVNSWLQTEPPWHCKCHSQTKSPSNTRKQILFLFFNSKLCSPQTWHILPNPENSWSRRLSPNHILCWHPCPSKKVCDIDPKSLGQVIHPKDVLGLLRRFENPNLHLTILQPEYSQFLPLTR